MGADTLGAGFSLWKQLPAQVKEAVMNESMDLAGEAYQYGKGMAKSYFAPSAGMSGNPSYRQQQKGAKRARSNARKAEGVMPVLGGQKLVPAQFNPGRGAELSWTRQNLMQAIRFKSGEARGPAPTNALREQNKLYHTMNNH